MKIAVDLDDTLSVVDRVTRADGYIRREGLPFKLIDPNAHALEHVFDWKLEDVLTFIGKGGITVFTDAEARRDAREVLSALRAAGHEIVVLTARQKTWFVNPEKVSRDWLEKRKIPYDELVADEQDKGRYCIEHNIRILIDDNPDVCLHAQELGVCSVLFIDEKYNGGRAPEIRFGASSWKQTAAVLNRLIPRLEG